MKMNPLESPVATIYIFGILIYKQELFLLSPAR